jgi:FAD/FMN-containing dehydrogenase
MQRCTPKLVAQPESLDEIQRLVRNATADGQVVRVVGAGHAFNGGALTNDVLINVCVSCGGFVPAR